MQQKIQSANKIAWPWLSAAAIVAFIIYWLFTVAIIFKGNKLQTTAPLTTAVYYSFINQNWHLFADTKLYNRELYLVVKDSTGFYKNDSIALLKFIIDEKRKQAPFNNKADATDHLIYRIVNKLEQQLYEQKKILQKKYPGLGNAFYMLQASRMVEQDSLHRTNLQSLENFAKYVMQQKNISTTAKQFQLILTYRYIQPPAGQTPIDKNHLEQIVFTSKFKPL